MRASAGAAISGKTPYGSAEFRVDSPSRSRLNVEVENVNLAPGTVLNVNLSHLGVPAVIGHITLSATGNGELELESQHGDVVPAVVSGDIVTVDNEGSPILAGVF